MGEADLRGELHVVGSVQTIVPVSGMCHGVLWHVRNGDRSIRPGVNVGSYRRKVEYESKQWLGI